MVEEDVRGGSGGVFLGFNPPPPRTAQLIVKFGEKVLQIDYRYCKCHPSPTKIPRSAPGWTGLHRDLHACAWIFLGRKLRPSSLIPTCRAPRWKSK